MKRMTIKDLYLYAIENHIEDLPLLVLNDEGRLSYINETSIKKTPAAAEGILLDPQ